MMNELNKFEVMNETQMMEIDGGGIGTALLVIGGIIVLSVGVYNGYKDTEQGAQ